METTNVGSKDKLLWNQHNNANLKGTMPYIIFLNNRTSMQQIVRTCIIKKMINFL